MLLSACLFPTSANSDLMAVRGEFDNALQVPPGTNPPADQSSAAAFFGGNVGFAAVPDGSVVLEQSSFLKWYPVTYPIQILKTKR